MISTLMVAITQGAGTGTVTGTTKHPPPVTVRDDDTAASWAAVNLKSLPIIAFAFMGADLPVTSTFEAHYSVKRSPERRGAIGKMFKSSAVWIPFFVTLLYVMAGLHLTINEDWNSDELPRLSWITSKSSDGENINLGQTHSAFVMVARGSSFPRLVGISSTLLMFTALTYANTNLYVASRTVYGLTTTLDGHANQIWYTKVFARLERTNHWRVATRSIGASFCFSWIPFLYLWKSHDPGISIATILNILSMIGSVGVIIVWVCQCWAFIRFWY
jgi:yeast amino acid transporter